MGPWIWPEAGPGLKKGGGRPMPMAKGGAIMPPEGKNGAGSIAGLHMGAAGCAGADGACGLLCGGGLRGAWEEVWAPACAPGGVWPLPPLGGAALACAGGLRALSGSAVLGLGAVVVVMELVSKTPSVSTMMWSHELPER